MISIIIPVYNGEKHIAVCYKSLYLQSYENWEAIFINDGSKDNSQKIIEDIASKDNRIKIVTQNNMGVAMARESGIKKAHGEYIMFLDVDDLLEPDALYNFIVNFDYSEIDIVVGGINIVSSNGKRIKSIKYPKQILDHQTSIDQICDGRIRWQLWAKVFRKELFEGIVTPIGLRSAEDMAVCVQLFLKSKKIKTIDSCVYNYIQIDSSATHANASTILNDNLYSTDFLVNITKESLSPSNIHCLYLLNISSTMHLGLEPRNIEFRKALIEHYKSSALKRLPFLKIINLTIYRYLNTNLFRYL